MSDIEERAFAPARRPWDRAQGLSSVIERWERTPTIWGNVSLDHRVEERSAQHVAIPETLAPAVRGALHKRGITQLYTHQAQALTEVQAGRDIVVATPTASGKSLCFHLPVMDRLARDEGARALYLFPTKALSRDQEESVRGLLGDAGLSHGCITFDGDTPGDARRAAKERSGVLITNPDMLHTGILPHHASWARLFSNLRYIVLDELHTYRGVFGSHLANVLRRLERIARFHGSQPVFITASATIGNPQAHARRMVGRDVTLVSQNGAPAGSRRVLVYNPPVVNAELGVRQSYVKAATRMTADLVRAGVSTILFGQSRNNIEVMLKYLRDAVTPDKIPASSIQGYRGGYLPGQRRNIEASLRAGDVRCVVATNALELGIDIGELDAVVCAGYPGSIAGLWQRFGRAGRRGEESLALMVASSAPLDQFIATRPTHLVGAPVEHARIDPDNVEILVQHMKCGAFELPFEAGEAFRDVQASDTEDTLTFLSEHRVVQAVPSPEGRTVYHWATDAYPANHVSLRSVGWDNVVVIEVKENKTIAEMDWRSSHTMLHEQAIYQHDGEQYQVERFDYENHKAYVRRVEPDYFTTAMTHTRVSVLEEDERADLPPPPDATDTRLVAGRGEVSVIEKVVGYKKIKFHTHENVGYGEIELPELQMHTVAFWLTVPEAVVRMQPHPRPQVIDSLRGILNALHTVACVGLMIDPRDLGRTVGSRNEPDGPLQKGAQAGPGFDPSLFLFDHFPGGVGLAPRLYEEREELLRRARALLESCACDDGCPSCIGPETSGSSNGRKRTALDLLSALGIMGVQ